jgi:hypothetical protein
MIDINMLPDHVLLEIFDFNKVVDIYYIPGLSNIVWWETLTKVCRRWRYIILASPRRLDLRLHCSEKTPTKRLLDIWPPFPITLDCFSTVTMDDKNVENVIAALERHDRTSMIFILGHNGSTLEKLFAVMQGPLPVLTHVHVITKDESAPVLPETFLSGSAPRLQSFTLHGIPFPSFPKFILSVTHIIELRLTDIPESGYVSPKVMATCLATLPNLGSLFLGFRSPLSRPLQNNPPPLTRAVHPTLTCLHFTGVSEYFEDLVARIDTPLLDQLSVTFFLDLIFDIPQLSDFVARTENLRPFNQAKMLFSHRGIKVILGSPTRFSLEIKCERSDWQLSSLTQIFSQQLPLLSHVEQLEIYEPRWESIGWKDDPYMDSSLWLELFQLFVAVQSLYVSKYLVLPVVAALQDFRVMGGTAVEVLPALLNLSLEGLEPSGPVQEAIKSFVASRQLLVSVQPIAIQRWDRQGVKRMMY